MVAGVYGPLTRVIETAALVVHRHGLGRLAGLELPEERGKDLDAERSAAGGACEGFAAIGPRSGNSCVAGVASKGRVVVSRAQSNSLAIANDARIADPVMKRAFLLVECRHDVTDGKN